MGKSNTFIIGAFLIITMLTLILFFNSLDAQERITGTFQLHYRELSEVTSKIKPLLSPQGSILIKPQARQIVIDDFAENIQAIAKLIKQLDIPPREINLYIYFIRAAKNRGKRSTSYELREIASKLGGFLNYDDYQLIASHIIKAKEGDITTLQLGEEYIVSFFTQIPSGANEVIKLKNFRLFKREKMANGRYRLKKLLVAAINLIDSSPTIIGASSSEESDHALIMALTAFIGK